MKLNFWHVALFFAVVALAAVLLFPTSFDVVSIYRNSLLFDSALGALEEMEARHPADRRVALERARVLFLTGAYQDAARLLEEITAQHPDFPDGWRERAKVYRAMLQHRQAEAALEQLLRVAPEDSAALSQLDEYYQWFQEPDRAVANLRAIVEQQPRNYHRHGDLVDVLLRAGDGDGAVAALRDMARQFPDSLEVREYLGDVLLARRDTAAIEVFAQLHEEHSERRDLFDRLCSALIVAGRREETLRRFEEFYGHLLPAPTYHRQRGQIYLYLADLPGAIAELERAASLGQDPAVWRQLAELEARRSRYSRSAYWAAQLVASDSANVGYWRLHADLLMAAGAKRQVVQVFEAAAARWPGDVELTVALADAYDWVEDYRRELQVTRGLVASQPRSARHRSRLARVLASLGRPLEAAPIYAGLLAGDPGSEAYREGLLRAARDASDSEADDARLLGWARQVYDCSPPGAVAPALLLADRFLRVGHAAAAEEVLARLAGRHRSDARLHARIGERLAAAHRRSAPAYFRRALDLDPREPTALSGLAGLLVAEAPGQAAALLERLAALRPGDVDVAYRAGLARDAAGDSSAAAPHFLRVVAQTSSQLPATAYEAQRRGHALWRTGRGAEALDLLAAARQQHARDAALTTDYAELLIWRGAYEEALVVLEEVPPP